MFRRKYTTTGPLHSPLRNLLTCTHKSLMKMHISLRLWILHEALELIVVLGILRLYKVAHRPSMLFQSSWGQDLNFLACTTLSHIGLWSFLGFQGGRRCLIQAFGTAQRAEYIWHDGLEGSPEKVLYWGCETIHFLETVPVQQTVAHKTCLDWQNCQELQWQSWAILWRQGRIKHSSM